MQKASLGNFSLKLAAAVLSAVIVCANASPAPAESSSGWRGPGWYVTAFILLIAGPFADEATCVANEDAYRDTPDFNGCEYFAADPG